jgi:hypothetical protein
MMVVGNKADMKKRAVSKAEGQNLANEFGAGFLEISVRVVLTRGRVQFFR